MAKRVEFGKFLILEVDRLEMNDVFGGPGLCDYCNEPMEKGYYIAVINCIYCPGCYENWKARSVWYPEDSAVEQRNYEFYAKRLGL